MAGLDTVVGKYALQIVQESGYNVTVICAPDSKLLIEFCTQK